MLRRPGPVSAKAAPPADHLVNILLPRAEAGAGPAPYPLPDSLGLGAAGGTEVVVAGDVPARKVTGRRGASDFDGAPATRRDFRQLQSSVPLRTESPRLERATGEIPCNKVIVVLNETWRNPESGSLVFICVIITMLCDDTCTVLFRESK